MDSMTAAVCKFRSLPSLMESSSPFASTVKKGYAICSALVTGHANASSHAIALENLSNTSDCQPIVKLGFGGVGQGFYSALSMLFHSRFITLDTVATALSSIIGTISSTISPNMSSPVIALSMAR